MIDVYSPVEKPTKVGTSTLRLPPGPAPMIVRTQKLGSATVHDFQVRLIGLCASDRKGGELPKAHYWYVIKLRPRRRPGQPAGLGAFVMTDRSNAIINADLAYTASSIENDFAAFDSLPVEIRRGFNFSKDTYSPEEAVADLAAGKYSVALLAKALDADHYGGPSLDAYRRSGIGADSAQMGVKFALQQPTARQLRQQKLCRLRRSSL